MSFRVLALLGLGLLAAACRDAGGLAVHEISYQKPPFTADPLFSPTAGTYSSDQSVALSSYTVGARIYYTTGTTAAATPDPTTASALYSSGTPIPVAGNGTQLTVKALAVGDKLPKSNVVTASFIINYSQVSTPQLNPPGGTYGADQSVVISCPTSGATLYYTTDGTTPSTASAVIASGGTVAVAGNGTVKTIQAVAYKTGMSPSTVASDTYTIAYSQAPAPVFSVAAGTYTTNQTLTVSSSVSGATISYTTDGTDPALYGTSAASPLNLAVNGPSLTTQTVRAIVRSPLYQPSSETSASYAVPVVATLDGNDQNYMGLAADVTGQYLVAAPYSGSLLHSSTLGASWAASVDLLSAALPVTGWDAAAVAAGTGQYMFAADRTGSIYSSLNYGANWTAQISPTGVYALASTYDGTTAVAAVNGGQLYRSLDYGVTWTAISGSTGGRAVAMSSTGTYMLAPTSSTVVTSSDSGTTWNTTTVSGYWNGAAVSSTGAVMVAVGSSASGIVVSTNYGASWSTAQLTGNQWYAVASSADGTHLIAVGNGVIAVSENTGTSWTTLPLLPGTSAGSTWYAVTCDSTGTHATAGSSGTGLWTLAVPN